jgi:hypothetical protein
MAQSLSSAADAPLSNSAARADTIRNAVRWIAEHKAEVKALNAEINEFMVKTVKGDLGFKIADFNAVYRVSQLEVEDRDLLLDCVREGFQALGIGGSVDWVAAAERTPRPGTNGTTAPDEAARTAGRQDGLGGVRDHAARWPQGEPGHADYMLGLADGESERERVMSLGESGNGHANGAGETAPKRGRGRPRKPRGEAEAEA